MSAAILYPAVRISDVINKASVCVERFIKYVTSQFCLFVLCSSLVESKAIDYGYAMKNSSSSLVIYAQSTSTVISGRRGARIRSKNK